ncbi:hypothetical protein DOTSEDRAFT_70806 [Dothistroma septosporum NZE10]|uniref:Uncharacterized protein n=1 Tax=Dothistroma septosporum (strain NZE10 / CBS 128990) TaxID=675120 RepID=N1PPL3_DOTSN|nr:hypothetical protein DOTSEDRAFT_70806 [Dothistroma septosporum NZE10]
MAGRRDASESTSTNFATIVALLSCIYNLLVAVSSNYLPDDPLGIGLGISLYAWSGTILSAVGLAGIVTKRPMLVTSFAHFLLIDTVISATCRLLILQYFIEAFNDHNVCAGGYEPIWSPQNFRHDIVTSVQWEQEQLWHSSHKRSCRVALGAVQVVSICVLMGMTAGQGSLAVMMRRHAKEMVRPATRGTEKPRRSPHPDEKTSRYEIL